MTAFAINTHHIFTEAITPEALGFLKQHAKTTPNIICYLPADNLPVPSPSSLPPNVTLKSFKDEDQVFDPILHAYQIGREIADTLIADLTSRHPQCFQLPGTPYDFQPLFTFNTQFHFARHQFNFWLNCVHQITASKTHQFTFLNFSYLFTPSWKVLAQRFPQLDQSNCDWQHTGDLPNRVGLKLTASLTRFKYRLKRQLKPTQNRSDRTGGTLSYVRASHHLDMVEPTLAILSESQPVTLLDYLPSKFHKTHPNYLTGRIDRYPGIHPTNPRQFHPSHTMLRRVHRHQLSLTKVILKQKEPVLRQQDTLLLAQLQKQLKQFLRLESIISHLQPTMVVACMEADAFSLILQELQKTTPFKTINHLHGVAPYFYAMDLCRFDAFMVWNQLTKEILIKDGYRDVEEGKPVSIQVVGTPFWEGNGDLDTVSEETEIVQDLRRWKGNAKLIVAYSTVLVTYVTPKQKQDYFETLGTFLSDHPTAKMVIKKHPNEFDSLVHTFYKNLPQSIKDRVRLMEAKELPLYESFRVADVAVAICSSVLQEALYYRVPAVSLDYEKVIALLGYGFEQIMAVVTDPMEAPTVLDRVLKNGIADEAFAEETRQKVFPKFLDRYPNRVRRVLSMLTSPQACPTL